MRMHPARIMEEESLLREAFEIIGAAIAHLSKHGHAERDHPTGDDGA